MSVKSIKPYRFSPRDLRKNFPAPLLYISWDEHLMFAAPFCIPLPEATPFAALSTSILPGMFGAHPDFEKIDWNSVEWFKADQQWQPDVNQTLAGNGLKHKDYLRFRTPGLHGLFNCKF